MNVDMTPIPTEYTGIQFRSELEAKWAIIFDICGWEWTYEEHGLRLANGKIFYKPDFILKHVHNRSNSVGTGQAVPPYDDLSIIVEVKGSLSDDSIKKAEACQEEGIHFIQVGSIPHGSTGNEILRNMQHTKTYGYYPARKRCDNCRTDCDGYGRQLCNRYIAGGRNHFLWPDDNWEPVIGAWHIKQKDVDKGNASHLVYCFNCVRNLGFDKYRGNRPDAQMIKRMKEERPR